jgi:hypothetical protein
MKKPQVKIGTKEFSQRAKQRYDRNVDKFYHYDDSRQNISRSKLSKLNKKKDK